MRRFKEKHKNSTTDEKINDVLLMLEHRGSEYLVHNYETYKQLWIDPNEDKAGPPKTEAPMGEMGK